MKIIKRNIVVLLLAFTLTNSRSTFSQPQLDLWQEYHAGGAIVESFKDIYHHSDGGYLIAGDSYASGWILKLTAEGEIEWQSLIDSSTFVSIIEADNGDAVAGGGAKPYNRAFRACRINNEGETLWQRDYTIGHCSAVIELKNNDFMLAGWSGFLGYIARIQRDGELIWGTSYQIGDINEYHRLYAIRETEGGVVAVGYYAPAGNNRTGWIIKVNFEGEVVWSRQFDGGTGREYYSLVSSPVGGFAVGGKYRNNWEWGSSEYKFCLTKIDAEGNVRDDRVYHLAQGRGDVLNGINKLADGFVLVGYTSGNGYTYPLALRIDRTLNPVWTLNYPDLVENRPPGRQPNTPTMLNSVIADVNGVITACGGFMSQDEGRGQDGLVVRLEPDLLGPHIFYHLPEDTVLTTLVSDTIDFVVRARTREGNELFHFWHMSDLENDRDSVALGNDTLQQVSFDSIGTYNVICRLSDADATIEITWHVTVTDLYISAFTPDTLALAVRRGASVDFSLDTVRVVPGDPIEYLWLKRNLDAMDEVDSSGEDAQATVVFLQSGHYRVDGMAYRGESSDVVSWDVSVRGAIWAFAPEELSFEVLPDSLVSFVVEPTVPDADGQTIQWLIDGEVAAEDTTQFEWQFSVADSSADLNRHYFVQVVVADSVESDTVVWTVTVVAPDFVDDKRDAYLTRAELLSLSPNPFNSTLTIRYSTDSEIHPTRLAVYDLSGREVARSTPHPPLLAGGEKSITGGAVTAERTFVWDASSVPAGVYFVRLQAGGEVVTKKVVLMR